MRNGFWLATIIIAGVFYFGDGIGHIVWARTQNNVAQCNSGVVLYFDLLIPWILLTLYFAYRRNTR